MQLRSGVISLTKKIRGRVVDGRRIPAFLGETVERAGAKHVGARLADAYVLTKVFDEVRRVAGVISTGARR